LITGCDFRTARARRRGEDESGAGRVIIDFWIRFQNIFGKSSRKERRRADDYRLLTFAKLMESIFPISRISIIYTFLNNSRGFRTSRGKSSRGGGKKKRNDILWINNISEKMISEDFQGIRKIISCFIDRLFIP